MGRGKTEFAAKSWVYDNKKKFVELLSQAYTIDESVWAITYTREDKTGLEFVHIMWPGGDVDHINVTINSHQAIAMEIARQITGTGAHGYVSDFEYQRRQEQWQRRQNEWQIRL
jgi:hypothetical protein